MEQYSEYLETLAKKQISLTIENYFSKFLLFFNFHSNSLCMLQNPWNIAQGICSGEEKLESSQTVFGSALAPFWLEKPSFPSRTQRLNVHLNVLASHDR